MLIQMTASTWVCQLRLVRLRETDVQERLALLTYFNVVPMTLSLQGWEVVEHRTFT